MKKVLLSAAVFLLCFSFGFWLKKSPPKSLPPKDVASALPLEQLTQSSAPLAHQFYFSNQVERSAASPIFWEKTEERFRLPLPADSRKHQPNTVRELATRLSILRSIGELEQFHKEKILLYSKIVKDNKQHWLLQREALYQLRPFLRILGQNEREKILAGVSSRVRTLASFSTQELLQKAGGEQ
jgi:hypothetical protein